MQSSYFYHLLQIDHIVKISDLPNEQQLTDSFVFIFHLKGDGKINIKQTESLLKKETLYICPPYETFGITSASATMNMYLLRLQIYECDEQRQMTVTNSKSFSDSQMIDVQSVGNLAARLQELSDLWPVSSTLQAMKSQIELQQLLYDICLTQQFHSADTASAIAETKRFIKAHSDASFTLNQLAKMAGISAKHYSETFKRLYGQSVTEFITETRITKAKRLMAKASYKLREIANQIGYQDEFYFSRTFKKQTGLSPTAYMKKRRRKLAAYGQNTIGQLIPLHLIPYAASLHPKWTAYYYKHYAHDIPVHLSAYRFHEPWEENLRMLVAAEPELIISMDDISKHQQEQLNQIADVLYLRSEENWRTNLWTTASYLKEETEARQWLAAYERNVELAREHLSAVRKQKFLFLRLHKHEVYLAHNRSVQEVFFGDLGCISAVSLDEPTNQAISLETIAAYDPDQIMVFIFKEPETLAYYQQLQQTAFWQNLKAVQQKQVHQIQSDPWREYSACSHERLIRQAVKCLPGKNPF
ncbi:AraC family transcriptional regulator [Bacillus sp. CLL-7-23]|uniref:AraC family transcriptional regulator n=1 Tax=Bacillus changyiensis TaxID=3004103 RepID=A0ABT4WZR3_9BACI|nr:AraC family transcriptional regulator [Bacillus changyiensis]MDA7025405.1 AraC family transcriptional regulator [Bacillus changyiensis]